jgi:hypothetical protein
MSMLFPHLGPSTPTFRCTCCARRHRSSSSTSVRERLASANALAISGKRCEPGFPDAEPFYTYTAPPRIFFRLTILAVLSAAHAIACPRPDTTTGMSMTSTSDNPNLQTTSLPRFVHTSTSLCYVVTHVFLPVRPPRETDYTPENSHSLARAVCAAAHAYGTHVCGISEQAQWNGITKMLDNLQASVQSEHMDNDHVISQLRGMETGGTFAGSPQIPGRADNL